MKNNKLNIDRKKVSSEEISGRMNFESVLKDYRKINKPFYKSSYFMSAMVGLGLGIAAIFIIVNNREEPQETGEEVVAVETGSKLNEGPYINPPFKDLNVQYKKYYLDAERGGMITYKTGSKVVIPSNAFSDMNGNPLKGKVEIRYKEFHDAVDFLVSGIPMTYDSAGVKYQLESAGMVEVLGFQNGKPVRIAKGKTLKIQMASEYEGGIYNLYFLDTLSRNWSFRGKDKVVFATPGWDTSCSVMAGDSIVTDVYRNTKGYSLEEYGESDNSKSLNEVESAQKEIAKIEKEKPAKPKKAVDERYRFNIDVTPQEFPEIYEYKGLLFEVGPENKNFNSGMYNMNWDEVEMKQGIPGINYNLTFTKAGKAQTFIVYPVYEGKDSVAIMKLYRQKYSAYKTKLEKRKEEERKKQEAYAMELKKMEEERVTSQKSWVEAEKKAKQEAGKNGLAINYGNIRRDFAIDNFGIWNSDCPMKYLNEVSVIAKFVDGNNKPLAIDIAYQIDKKKNTLFCNYLYKKPAELKYDPNGTNMIFAVLTNQKLGIFSEEDFKKADPQNGKFTFVLKETARTFKTTDELKAFVLSE
jgi:hypothetical protein